MRGIIEQWKDDRGFGFIKPDDGSEKNFFHISSVKTKGRRPQTGDIVLFESIMDSSKRKKAKNVVIEGVVTSTGTSTSKSRSVPIEPLRRAALDYFLIFICICSIAAARTCLF
jgi:cold shock CspA family protein